MRVLTQSVRNREVIINVIEQDEDLAQFVEFVKRNPVLGFDTETTGGFNIFDNRYKLRVCQFGNGSESYVILVEKSAKWAYFAGEALKQLEKIVIQNASFDVLVVGRHLGVQLDWTKVVDTKILAHLVNSRPASKGGIGHSLELLTAYYIDKVLAAEVKGSMKALAEQMRITHDEVWWRVDSANEVYLRYAGLDPVLAFMLYEILMPLIPQSARKLIPYEHQLARIAANMVTRGIRLDQVHTKKQVTRFKRQRTLSSNKALDFGIESVDAPAQVVEAFKKLGVTEFEKTDSGAESANSVFLKKMLKEPKKSDIHKLAKIVTDAKRANKWNTAYFEKFLSTVDSTGRIHPGINTTQARTARYSITNPAAQTLPSDSRVIRDCTLADEGHLWVTIDYEGQELRMAAAVSGDQVMMNAFEQGLDLHQITADSAEVDRKIGKMANFLTVFGGGAPALVTQGGVELPVAKRVIKSMKTTYPQFEQYSKETTRRAKVFGYVETPTGRRLHTDDDRPYSGINYIIQSGSRDVTGNAMIQLDKAGFGPYMLLPVHDEINFSFPADNAEEMAREAAKLMEMELNGVRFTTDIQIGAGEAWGSIPDFAEKEFHFDEEGEVIDEFG